MCGRDIRIEGGLLRIAQLEGDGYEFLDNPKPLIEALRSTDTKIDLFTFTQKLPDSEPKYSYPREWDNFAALPVTTFDHWWDKQIKSFPRNRARQAGKRGVSIRVVEFSNELVLGIWRLYNECPVRQGRQFRHYGKSLETVYRETATFLYCSAFIGAFFEDELIGFVKLTWDETKTQANLMNILSMMKHRDKAPTNALIASSVRFCAEQGIRFLVYQSFAYGKKAHDSVSHFKEINGFIRMDVPRYYVPLSSRGILAYRLGLHHKLADRLPETIMAELRKARAAWYNRKLESSLNA
jgi:hypothetical protein